MLNRETHATPPVPFTVRLATSAADRRAAQRLRYQVFALRNGIASLEDKRLEEFEPDVHWLAVEELEELC